MLAMKAMRPREGVWLPWLGRVSRHDLTRARVRRRNARLRGVALVGLGLIGMKVHAIFTFGDGAYAQKVATLSYGSWFDRTISWMMEPDPITLSLAHIARQTLG